MTAPTNDRQTSELVRWLRQRAVWHGTLKNGRWRRRDLENAVDKIEQLQGEVAELKSRLMERFSVIRDLDAEIAALRAENEALRTVTDEDVLASCRIYAQGPGSGWQMPCNQMRDAIQSFIRSKESRRE